MPDLYQHAVCDFTVPDDARVYEFRDGEKQIEIAGQPVDGAVHCTSTETIVWVTPNDPECRPFTSTAKCFSDGSETFNAVDANGTSYATIEDIIMAGATPYLPRSMKEVCEYHETRNYYMAGGTAATVQDLIDAAIAAETPTIGDPAGGDQVAVDLAQPDQDLASWSLCVLPCESDVVLADGTAVTVADGDDSARIGGLLATADGDGADGGSDASTTLADYNAGTVFSLSFVVKNCIEVKA